MPVKLFYLLASPPVRAVHITLKVLDIPHELVNVNPLDGETRSEEFLKVRNLVNSLLQSLNFRLKVIYTSN
jgi:glutathione S-transferase